MGDYSEQMLREKAIVATRQLAKRQMTWLRSWPDVTFFDALDSHLASKVKNHCENAS